MAKLPSDVRIEVALQLVKEVAGDKGRVLINLERLEKEIEPLKGRGWDRFIVVRLSARKYAVASAGLADWEFRVCTCPLSYSDVHRVKAEYESKGQSEWSRLARDSYVVLGD